MVGGGGNSTYVNRVLPGLQGFCHSQHVDVRPVLPVLVLLEGSEGEEMLHDKAKIIRVGSGKDSLPKSCIISHFLTQAEAETYN